MKIDPRAKLQQLLADSGLTRVEFAARMRCSPSSLHAMLAGGPISDVTARWIERVESVSEDSIVFGPSRFLEAYSHPPPVFEKSRQRRFLAE